ncbi:uncharacterized protein LOC134749662 [Cydia strobilella]|uniref:uncharacterized protein LOC134749662 n=1 Tax=Cydia strobilella TaxID=1100964 RepID=UPI003003AA63
MVILIAKKARDLQETFNRLVNELERHGLRCEGQDLQDSCATCLMYGAECWTMAKKHEQQLHTAEMKMLRWAGGVTRLDRIRNEHVRGTFRVAPIIDKVKESRLRWHGHIMRQDDRFPVKSVLNIPTKSLGRGKPPDTWWSNIKREMKAQNLTPMTTQNRASWRRRTRRPDSR